MSAESRTRSGLLPDLAMALLSLGASLAFLSRHSLDAVQPGPGGLDVVSVTLAACSTLPLLAWRRAPRVVFAVTSAAVILLSALDYSIGLPFGPVLALYLLASSRDEADPWTRRDSAMSLLLLAGFLGATAATEPSIFLGELFHAGLAWSLAWFAGDRTRLRRERVEEERRLAVAEERARIARDLHDSAGHAINVIAMRAGTARLRHDDDPDRSREALETIERIARDTAGEIDQIVGSLRDGRPDNGDRTAPRGLASLRTLIENRAAGGLDVTVATGGTPRALASSVDQAAYRILQEALANAARHGDGAAQVELAYAEGDLAITVTNPVSLGVRPRTGGGHGLVGMRERASLVGGSLSAGRVNGSFRLRARLPYGGSR